MRREDHAALQDERDRLAARLRESGDTEQRYGVSAGYRIFVAFRVGAELRYSTFKQQTPGTNPMAIARLCVQKRSACHSERLVPLTSKCIEALDVMYESKQSVPM